MDRQESVEPGEWPLLLSKFVEHRGHYSWLTCVHTALSLNMPLVLDFSMGVSVPRLVSDAAADKVAAGLTQAGIAAYDGHPASVTH